MHVLVVAGHARLHARLQVLLVPERTRRHLRVGDRDENTAADISREVDEARDLVALFFREADVSGMGEGDEPEGEGQHRDDADPRRPGEAHTQAGDRGGVAEGKSEHDEAADGKRTRIYLAGGPARQWHNDY